MEAQISDLALSTALSWIWTRPIYWEQLYYSLENSFEEAARHSEQNRKNRWAYLHYEYIVPAVEGFSRVMNAKRVVYMNLSLTCKSLRAFMMENAPFKVTHIGLRLGGPIDKFQWSDSSPYDFPKTSGVNTMLDNFGYIDNIIGSIGINVQVYNPMNVHDSPLFNTLFRAMKVYDAPLIKKLIETARKKNKLNAMLNETLPNGMNKLFHHTKLNRQIILNVALMVDAGTIVSKAGATLNQRTRPKDTLLWMKALLHDHKPEDFRTPHFDDIAEIFNYRLTPEMLRYLESMGFDFQFAQEKCGIVQHFVYDLAHSSISNRGFADNDDKYSSLFEVIGIMLKHFPNDEQLIDGFNRIKRYSQNMKYPGNSARILDVTDIEIR